jgi:hypothetical protein
MPMVRRHTVNRLGPVGKLAGMPPRIFTFPPGSSCMLFVEGHKEHVNTIGGPNAELCNVKPDYTYTKHKAF